MAKGTYLEYPKGQVVHDSPRWQIKEGHVNTNTGEVYLSVETTGSYTFSYSWMVVQLVKVKNDGKVEVLKVGGFGTNGVQDIYNTTNKYKPFSNTIHTSFSGVKSCYLSMACGKHADTAGKADCENGAAAATATGWKIPGTELEVGDPPTLTEVINKKPYNSDVKISEFTDAIWFSWKGKWGDPAADSKVYYRLNGGTTVNAGHVDPVKVTNLKPGTSYKIEMYVQNSAGSTGWKSITIRTRYEAPVISLPSHTVDLECFTINWECTRPLKSLSYKISDVAASTDLCDWTAIAITSGDTSGTFETCVDGAWMDPKKEYTITFKGVSTDDYDYLDSNQPTLTDTTLDRSHIASIGSCIFGLSIDITITAESEKHHRLKIWTEGNDLTPTFTFDDLPKGVYTFTPTQDQLDQMYRSIPNTGNTVPIHFLLTTHGDHLDWDDTQNNQTLTLTGIAKTVHVGDENDKPRRCQVWIGDENNKPRRVVTWVGDANGKARRTI